MSRPDEGSLAPRPGSGRRQLIAATSLVGLGAVGRPATGNPAGTNNEAFTCEVRRSEQEWRARLSEDEYRLLRNGGTEQRRSSPLWNTTARGRYCCKGCDLTIFDGRWKVVLEIGWLFFRHSQPDAVLTSIDGPVAEYGSMGGPASGAMIEVHCRRCGSHLGHLLLPEGQLLFCVNGGALNFQPEST